MITWREGEITSFRNLVVHVSYLRDLIISTILIRREKERWRMGERENRGHHKRGGGGKLAIFIAEQIKREKGLKY